MTLEQLRIFVAVAERQHVTAAARALHLTQSAVSNAIAALEQRHDVRLFDRVGRGIALTQAGQDFLGEARSVLARAEAAEAALMDMGALRRGRLRMFASQTIASYWLPQLLVAFQARYPGVQLAVALGNTRDVVVAVLEGAAELGFVEGAVADPLLGQRVIGVDEMLVLAAPGHGWAGRTGLGVDDVQAMTWLMREEGSGTRSSLERALAEAGVAVAALQVAMTLPSNEALVVAAQAGAGVIAVSALVAQAALDAGRLVRVDFKLPPRHFYAVWHMERAWSRAAAAFMARI